MPPTQISATNNEAQGAATDLVFSITPTVFIPTSAIIKITLDDSFTVGAVQGINYFNEDFKLLIVCRNG